jgi:peptidyl-prolyl cis-trans isomerase SurA
MKHALTALLTFLFIGVQSQTLFTYGKNSVSKDEFLRAFNKNNTGNNNTEKAFREYLDLYTRFKLKVQAGYDAKLETLPNQVAELQNFRSQIVDGFMNDDNSVQELTEEAFRRSQKDIRISHIYLPYSGTDTAAAFQKATEAYNKLQAGADFGTVATTYSADPSVRENKGDIGYITVFILPYDLETLAYTTAAGKVSKIFRSKTAYHIFKNTAERPAAGRMKASQILIAYTPGAGDPEMAVKKILADSIYEAIKHGASFKEMVTKYSNDNISYQAGGLLPEFGVGRYSGDFENAVFALAKDGDISKPFPSAYGYHIVQRIERVPVNSDKNNADAMALLKQAVQGDNRIEVSKRVLLQKITRSVNYKKVAFNESLLWIYADSAASNKKLPQSVLMNDKTVLFSFPKQNVTAADFGRYLDDIKNTAQGRGKTYPELLAQYTQVVTMEYYRNHLEDYNKEFATQLKEFKEGNLLFEIMQRQVWDKAAADSAGLITYYNSHKNKYWWEASADVLLFTCSDSVAAVNAKAAFLKNMKDWRTIVQNSDGMVQADSGRFELTQLPVTVSNIKPGYISAPTKTSSDNITSFVYVMNVYNERTPRNFEDAKGFVINDYQGFLENKWIDTLKKKYPVKVNEAVLKTCWTTMK